MSLAIAHSFAVLSVIVLGQLAKHSVEQALPCLRQLRWLVCCCTSLVGREP